MGVHRLGHLEETARRIEGHSGHMISAVVEAGKVKSLRCTDCGVDLDFGDAKVVLREPDQRAINPLALEPLSPTSPELARIDELERALREIRDGEGHPTRVWRIANDVLGDD